MAGEILTSNEAKSAGHIHSDLDRVRQRSPAAKDPAPFGEFVLRTAPAEMQKGPTLVGPIAVCTGFKPAFSEGQRTICPRVSPPPFAPV
jgi:hypothetical protein